MPSGSESPDLGTHVPGSHQLGPHVVGQRVVVRRLVPGETGPSGGPAMTDVLGICLAWDPCVVQPESGPPVTIPLALIVSGKPVPPRPSPRQRVSPAEAESHVAGLWPHLETVALGGWTLRSDPAPAGRLRRRANSCLAMGDPGLPFADALDEIRAFYAARGRDVLAQVEVGSDVDQAFRDHGWVPLGSGDAHFELASLARVRRVLAAVPGLVDAELTDEDSSRVSAATGAGSGHAVVDGDWLAIHDMEVAPAHRRQGHARGVLAALLEWGAEQGATTVWLHVETDNEAALSLYESLGFAVHHTCRYLVP